MSTTENILQSSQDSTKHFRWGVILTYALLLCPFIIAHPTNTISYLAERFLQIFCIGIWFICLYKLLLSKRRRSPANRVFGYLIHMWWIFLICNSFVQIHLRQFTHVYNWLVVWSIMLLAELYWTQNYKRHLYYLGVMFSVLVYLNIVLFILFPDGLWEDTGWIGMGDKARYLFGNYNQTGMISLMALMIWGVYVLITRKGYLNMIMLMVCSVGVIIAMGSMTSAVGVLLVCMYFLLHRFIKHPFRWIAAFVVVYVGFFGLVVWQGQDLQNWPILTDFVVKVLHKDTTFTYRVYLWLRSVSLIRVQPWVGYGAQDVEWMVASIGGSGPHNLWLMTLLRGGLISTILLISIITIIMVRLWKNRSVVAAYAAVCISVLMLMSLFETYTIICLFFVLIVAYYVQPVAKIKPNQAAAVSIGQTEEDKAKTK